MGTPSRSWSIDSQRVLDRTWGSPVRATHLVLRFMSRLLTLLRIYNYQENGCMIVLMKAEDCI